MPVARLRDDGHGRTNSVGLRLARPAAEPLARDVCRQPGKLDNTTTQPELKRQSDSRLLLDYSKKKQRIIIICEKNKELSINNLARFIAVVTLRSCLYSNSFTYPIR